MVRLFTLELTSDSDEDMAKELEQAAADLRNGKLQSEDPESPARWEIVQSKPVIIFKYPGGEEIEWKDQKNGDLILAIWFRNRTLNQIELWRVKAEGPVFRTKEPLPSGYWPVHWSEHIKVCQDGKIDSLELLLKLHQSLKYRPVPMDWSKEAEELVDQLSELTSRVAGFKLEKVDESAANPVSD